VVAEENWFLSGDALDITSMRVTMVEQLEDWESSLCDLTALKAEIAQLASAPEEMVLSWRRFAVAFWENEVVPAMRPR